MANNNTNTNLYAPAPASQADDQTIKGQIVVQQVPGKPAKASNSVSGEVTIQTPNTSKGKGNN